MNGRAETIGRAMHQVETQPGVAGRIAWEMLTDQHRDAYWQMYLAARAADDDLIRRQDAALTAVRELVDRRWTAEDYERLHPALQPHSHRAAMLRALASPDTTQEAGA